MHRLRILLASAFVARRSRGTVPTDALPMRSIRAWAAMLALATLASPSLALAQSVNETNSAPVTLTGNYTVATTGVTTFQKTSPGGLEFTGTISGGGSGATLFLNTTAADSLTTFTFSGSNSFAGQITLNRGSLVVNNLSAFGNPANVVYLNSYVNNTLGNLRFNLSGTFANPINNADVAYDNTIGVGVNNVTLTGSIYGNGGLTKYGIGTLTITGSNTYANGTTIAAGTLQVGNGGATGSLGSGAVSNSGAIVFNRSGSLTVAGAISGTGSLAQAGSGATVLTGGNTYTGATTISSGTLQVGNGGSGSTIGGSGTIANNGSLVFNIGDSQTLFRPVAGTGSFTKAGAGNLTLSGTNAYSGGTVISSGTLAVAGPANIGTGTVSFTGASGLTVTGSSATFANDFDLGSVGGLVRLGTPINSLTTIDGVIRGGAADTVLYFEGGGSGQNTGALRLNGINTLTGTIQIQQGPLILGNASAAGAARIVLNSNLPAAGALQFADSFTIANGVITNTQIDKIGVSTGLTGGISGVISGAAGIEKVGAGRLVLSGTNTYAGATVISSGTLQVGDGGAAGTLGGGAVSNGGALVFNRSDALTVSSVISGTGSLTQAGPGATVLTGGNTYTGATTISSGTLQVGNGGSGSTIGGTGAVANNGSLIFNIGDSQMLSRSVTGSGNLVKSGAGTLTLSGNNSYFGGTTISGGTLTVAGTSSIGPGQVRFTAPSALTVTSTAVTFPNAFDLGSVSGTVTLMVSTTSSTVINGPITGGNAGTTLFFDNPVGGANTGILTLNGTNSFQGSLMVYRGPLILGNAAAAGASTIQLFANNNPAGDLQFTTGFTIANNVELVNGGVGNWIGVPSGQTNGISGVISGNGFTKIGAGTLVLEADNNYSGGTTFTSGAIQVGNGAAAGSLGSGAVANGGVLVFNRSGSLTVSSAISGTGSVTTAGPGTIVLSGSNSFSGGTVLSAGVLALGSANALGSTGTVSFGGGTLQYSASNTTDYSGRFSTAAGQQYAIDTNGQAVTLGSALISSGGSLTKTGLGTLTLGGTNSYAGGTVVSAGRLVGTTASLQGAITNDATVEFAQATSGTYSGAMSGVGALVKTGSGGLVLAGPNTYDGTTTISSGTLQVGNGGTAGALAGTGTVTNDGSLAINRSDAVTFSRPITGSGGFQQIGSGTTTLAGVNSYAGTTTIAAGRLVGSTASLPGAIANASQLEFAQASDGTFAFGVSGTGSLTKTGVGNLILSGSSSYSGATSVTAGRLSVNGSLGTSPIAVLAAAELGGSGSIAGPVSVAAGGTLSPGNSIASLATGTATFAAGATFEYEVDSTNLGSLGTAADLLVVNGDLDIASGTLLTFLDLATTPNPFIEDTTIFAMINYSGSWNGGLFTYNGTALTDGSRFTVGSQLWEIDYNRTSSAGLANFTGDYVGSNFVTVTAVPEPSTLVLIGIGLGGLLLARRRAFRKNSLAYRNIPI
ncbi:MAG: beta strand repeat-containing protein [Planctomycetia bacterium]